MKLNISIELDLGAGALYITLREGHIAKTVEFAEEVFVDLDSNGKVLGIEMLNPGTISVCLPKIASSYHIPALRHVRAKALEQVFAYN